MVKQRRKRAELMSRLSKETEYAIKYLLESKKMDPKDVAKELKIKITTVNKFLSPPSETEKTAPAKTDKTKELMIRQTSSKKNNTVSIMTESASQLSDEFIKTINSDQIKRTQEYIFRPKAN
jgi:hypothetical protein